MSNEIIRVDFHGDNVECARDDTGIYWVMLPPICARLGDLRVEDQAEKLKKIPHMVRVGKIPTRRSDGQIVDQWAVNLDGLLVWLMSISLNRVKREVRPVLKQYQTECPVALRNHFFPTRPAAPAASPLPAGPTQADLDAFDRGKATVADLVERKQITPEEGNLRVLTLHKVHLHVDLFRSPPEQLERMGDPLEKAVTNLNPGDSIRVTKDGKTTDHFARVQIPAGYLLASSIAPKFGVTEDDVRKVARALGIWQREPEWGLFDGMSRKTGLPEPGTGGFFFSPAAQERMRHDLERAATFKGERLSYARALVLAAAAGPGALEGLRGALGTDLIRRVRELTRPSKCAPASEPLPHVNGHAPGAV